MSSHDTYLTAVEASAVLRISPAQVVNLCRDGDIKATKPGKQWLIAQADLIAYLDESTNQPGVVA